VKVETRRIEGFLRAPDPALSIFLLHGPDAGLVSERAQALGRRVVEDLGDPFRVSEVQEDQLRQEPQRLIEEAQALCMLGGRRLVRVRPAGDGCRRALELLLEPERCEAVVIFEADELGTSSSLRQIAERSPKVAAIACYRDTARGLETSIRGLLDEFGLRVAPDAMPYLTGSLGADRGITRRELEKLALFKLDRPGPITRDEIEASLVDAAAIALDDAVYGALLGDLEKLDRSLERVLGEGMAPVRILRTLAGVLVTLLRCRARMEQGQTSDAALTAARPPIHFSIRDRAKTVLERHSGERLARWLARVQETEIRCKSARAPDRLLCRQLFLDLARAAAPPPRGDGRRATAPRPAPR
jgi:DNA polymerase III subunit delta